MDDLKIVISALLDKKQSESNIKATLAGITTTTIKVKADTSSVTKSIKSFNADLEKSIATNRLSAFMRDNPIAVQKNAEAFGRLSTIVKEFTNPSDVRNWNKEFRNLSLGIKAAGDTGTTAFASMGKEAKKFFNWTIASFGVMSAIRGIQQMVENVRDLDTAMTELRKTTDETEASYSSFVNRAGNTSVAIGSKVSDFINATAEFSRAGFSLSESEELARVASLYKNVGDEVKSISDSSSVVISTLKAFNLEANQSIHIVDALNDVGNKYAVGSSGLGESLRRSASALASANNTLEESLGLLTAADEIIQQPEVTGTALKTIAMRLRNTAGALQEMDEDADGAAESITKLQQQISSLTGGAVNIMEDANTFKSTYDIIVELSKVWGNLSDKTQADLTRLIAGVRQGNVFNALMSNMSNGIKATSDALNSNGSAIAENEKYLNSINGKIEQLNASFEKLSANTVDSGTVKGVIDLARGFTDLTSTVGLGNIAIGTFALIAGSKASAGTGLLSKGITALIPKLWGAHAATSALGMAFQTFLPVAGILLAIWAIDKLIVTVEEQKQKVEEVSAAYNKTTGEIESVNAELDKMIQRISELNKLQQSGGLTLIQQEELSSLRETVSLEQNRLDILKERLALENASLNKEAEELYRKQFKAQSSQYIDPYPSSPVSFNPTGSLNNELYLSPEQYIESGIRRFNELSSQGYTVDNNEQMKQIHDNLINIGGELSDIMWQYKAFDQQSLQTYQDWNNSLETINKTVNPEKWRSNKFQEIMGGLNDSLKSELATLSADGGLTADVLQEKYAGLVKQFSDAGISIEQLAIEFQKAEEEIVPSAQAFAPYQALRKIISDTSDEGQAKLKELKAIVDTALDWRENEASVQSALDKIEELTGIKIDISTDGAQDTLNMLNAYLDGSIDKFYEYMLAAAKASGVAIGTGGITSALASIIAWLNSGTEAALQFAAALQSIGAGSYQRGGIVGRDADGNIIAADRSFAFNQSFLDNLTSGVKSKGGGGSKKDILEAYKTQKAILDHRIEMSQKSQELMEEDTDVWRTEQQKQLEIYREIANLIASEMERLKSLGYKATSAEMMQLESQAADVRSKIYSTQKAQWESAKQARIKAFEAEKKAAEEAYKKLVDQYDYEISKTQALLSLESAFHDLQKQITSEQRTLNNELKKAQELYPSPANAFSTEDFAELSDKLEDINSEVSSLYDDYLTQINSITVDTAYQLDYITSQFEQQLALKTAEYNIAKQDLAVAKARKDLENVGKERNVAQLQDGKWVWGSDPQAVAQAMDALTSAEEAVLDARSDYEYQLKANALESAMATIEMQKALAEKEHEAVMERIEKQIEALNEQLFSMIQSITNMNMFADGTLDAFEALALAIQQGTAAIDAAAGDALAAIKAAGSESGSYSTSTAIKSGSKGDSVTAVQDALIKLGYDVGKTGADGVYGSKTTAAVKQYQKDSGLKSDGIVGNNTVNALLNSLKSKGYADGGVVRTTGLEMLHGTKNEPEVVFKNADTDKLFNLVNSEKDLTGFMLNKVDTLWNKVVGSSAFGSISNIMNNQNKQTTTIGKQFIIQKIEMPDSATEPLSVAFGRISPLLS